MKIGYPYTYKDSLSCEEANLNKLRLFKFVGELLFDVRCFLTWQDWVGSGKLACAILVPLYVVIVTKRPYAYFASFTLD